ncbi:hypothetical protein EW026_g6034 [Hermanssonia centrifuga]|uniref:Importin-9 n=1 Tax=Hermanssonia centrifuga TaxID=98765 RepID=A0A4S4KGN6_9APHY|nr:hypothetical protein EW026_g6034 [Hermanssonia centrifuga]
MDPRNDVESTPNWDGIAIKREVIKTIDTIRNGFPRVLKPHLPDFLTAALKHLTALFPTYYHYYVLAEDSVPNSSEDEKIELSQFASSTLDLLANVARNGGAKTWFDQSNVTALIAEVFRWAEMTTDDVNTEFHSLIYIEGRSGQPDPINVKQLLVDVVPNLLSLSEFPFLQGRAFVFASQFAKLLPSELAGNYLDAVIQVLESQDGSIPVKVSAILAAKGFCKNSGVSTVVPRAPRICKCIEGFVQITTADTLTLIQETLSALLSVQEGQWMTVQLAESLIPATLNVMHNNIRDPVLMATISSILGQLAAVPIPGMYEVVISHAVPILCQAIVQPDGSPAAAIDQVCGLLEGAPQGKLGANFMNTLAPCLFGAMKTMEDRDGIQAGISALTLIVKKRLPSTGGVARPLYWRFWFGLLFIGDLIIQIIRNAGDAILPILPELLQAMVRRMTSAKTATFVQSLVIPFAFLIHSGHRDTVLGLLESFDVNGRSGLNVFINTWCENAETFQGYWNTRVNSLALIDVFMSQRPSLQNLLVKGDLIIDPGTEGVIMTRSKTRAVPTQFTSIPFPLKALKLLLHDLQTESEPASLGYMGIKESDVADLDSDDGDEEWDTEATAEALDVGSDDLTRMLGGHGVPPEMVGIVAEMAATPSMRSTPTQFERDPLYDTDGEDLSDPIYQVDLRDCIISFVRGCATQNTSNFSAIVDKLTPEEIMVARKAVTGEQNGSESF